MEALFQPSSAVPVTDFPFSLTLQMPSNFNRRRLKSSSSSRKTTLIKAVFPPFLNSPNNPLNFRSIVPKSIPNSPARINATSPSSVAAAASTDHCDHWMVIVERPRDEILQSKEDIVKYYVSVLQRVLGSSEKDPQSCIYDVSCDKHFGFCCDIDQVISRALSGLPEVLLVKPDPNRSSGDKDYSASEALQEGSRQSADGAPLLFPAGSSKHWLVRMDRPKVDVVSKAQMVDFYVQTLTKVLGNEKDAQMCIYHVSWQSNLGFCCELDEESATELAGVPGVISVQPDRNFGSENKVYRGDGSIRSTKTLDPSDAEETMQINPKKLFITGLSFYTSEKTLRAAFEPFGELVEVKVIMDKISKRSKGYAFLEYTTEEAASVALQEMNGKIINGWMIVVDRAKSKPGFSRAQRRPKA